MFACVQASLSLTMAVNPGMAERRRRGQEVTGKIGYVPPPDAYASAQVDREASDEKANNRKRAAGNMRSVGDFVNAPGANQDVSYYQPHTRTSPLPGFYADEPPGPGNPGPSVPHQPAQPLLGNYRMQPPPAQPLVSPGGRVSPTYRTSPVRAAPLAGGRGSPARGRGSPSRAPVAPVPGGIAGGPTEEDVARREAQALAEKDEMARRQRQVEAAALTPAKEFGALMDMVYQNHAESQRCYLDFRPDKPLY